MLLHMGKKLFAWHWARSHAGQVGRLHLAVNPADLLTLQKPHQMGERNF
jgi:hypothetical protein